MQDLAALPCAPAPRSNTKRHLSLSKKRRIIREEQEAAAKLLGREPEKTMVYGTLRRRDTVLAGRHFEDHEVAA
jgi:hypothetical protein